ncbi:hypothetical protein C8R46DRAFT_1030549 [Mycena filopes]|nr:hypothetical protein C8R46DRAFT_1030549 [Mycena filopes]
MTGLRPRFFTSSFLRRTLTTQPSYSIIPDPSLRLKLPRSEALRFIAGQPAHKQIQYHISNQDYYARDGVPGHTYCCGVLPTPMYRELRAGVLSTTDFEANLLVKYGVTLNIAARQLDYRKCDGLDTTMWFWSLPTMQRYRLERLIHLDLLCNGPRDARTCSGCHTVHREFWPLSVAGSFLRLRGCALDLQAAIGEHNMEVLCSSTVIQALFEACVNHEELDATKCIPVDLRFSVDTAGGVLNGGVYQACEGVRASRTTIGLGG